MIEETKKNPPQVLISTVDAQLSQTQSDSHLDELDLIKSEECGEVEYQGHVSMTFDEDVDQVARPENYQEYKASQNLNATMIG